LLNRPWHSTFGSMHHWFAHAVHGQLFQRPSPSAAPTRHVNEHAAAYRSARIADWQTVAQAAYSNQATASRLRRKNTAALHLINNRCKTTCFRTGSATSSQATRAQLRQESPVRFDGVGLRRHPSQHSRQVADSCREHTSIRVAPIRNRLLH